MLELDQILSYKIFNISHLVVCLLVFFFALHSGSAVKHAQICKKYSILSNFSGFPYTRIE